MKTITTKFQQLSIQAKASIVYLIINIFQKTISYISIPIITRSMTTEEYGVIAVYMSWKEVLGIFATFCLAFGVFNNGMSQFENRRDRYTFSMLTLSNLFTLITLGIVLLLCNLTNIETILTFSKTLIILMFFTFLFEPAYTFWIIKNRFEYNYTSIAAFTIVMTITSNFIAIIIMLSTLSNKPYNYLIAKEFTNILFYICIYFVVGRKVRWSIDVEYWSFAVKFNAPLIIHYLSKYILNSSDRIMIANLTSNSSAAKYSLAYSASQAIFIIWNALENTLIPVIYDKVKNCRYNEIGIIVQPISYLFLFICFFIALFAPEIISVMASQEYYQCIFIFPVLVTGIYCSSLYSVFSHIIYASGRPCYVMFASVLCAFLNIILNYVYIPVYGYIIAAYTTLGCYLLQAVIDFLILKFYIEIDAYPIRFIIICIILTVLVNLILLVSYNFYIVRVILIAISLFMIYYKRSFLYQLLRRRI